MDLVRTTKLSEILEGYKLAAYWDPIGKVWTIGWGFNLTAAGVSDAVARRTVWTQAQADAKLAAGILNAVAGVSDRWPWWNKLDDVRQAVMVVMAFQMGVLGLAKWEPTLALIEAGHYDQAVDHFLFKDGDPRQGESLWHKETPHRVQILAAMLGTGEWPAGLAV